MFQKKDSKKNDHVSIDKEHHSFASFSEDAVITFHEKINEFSLNIIKEVRRIEESERETGASSEITSSIILQAFKSNKNIKKKKKKKFNYFIKLLASLSLIAPGFLYKPEIFTAEGKHEMLIFLGAFAFATLINLYNIILQEKD